MTTDYDRMAADFEEHAADSAYNAHYDRPAVLELVGDVAGKRVLDAVAAQVSTPRSFSRVALNSLLWMGQPPWSSWHGDVSVLVRAFSAPI